VLVRRLELVDFRNYEVAEVELARGFTAVTGANGEGKTNLVEAVAYLATLESFRGAAPAALVRDGCERAVVRGEVEQDDGRLVAVECELGLTGRSRVQVNKQRLQRTSDLLGVLRVSVFSPDDLALVKDAPGVRRRFLDDTLVALHPRHDRLRREVERVLRQKAALLKQSGGRLGEDTAFTLDVWDARLAEAGDAIGQARGELVDALAPEVARAYDDLASRPSDVTLGYEPAWRAAGLAEALRVARADEVRRQVCLVGPHRDELQLTVGGLPARTHASQGEQRTLALALRLGAHRLIAERTRTTPVLLLDDVFSELDEQRGAALLTHLPVGQIVLTTAGPLPPGADVERILRVERGTVCA
jgi:DNA replication and repair protein RecF